MSPHPNAAELRVLLAKATEAPWGVALDEANGKEESWGYWHRFGPFTMCVSDRKAIPEPLLPNVDLVLWLRNHADALLAGLERAETAETRVRVLEGENARLREAAKALDDSVPPQTTRDGCVPVNVARIYALRTALSAAPALPQGDDREARHAAEIAAANTAIMRLQKELERVRRERDERPVL